MSSEGGGAARGIAGQAARDSRFAGPGLKGTGVAEAAAARDEGHPLTDWMSSSVIRHGFDWVLGPGVGQGLDRKGMQGRGSQGQACKGRPGRASLEGQAWCECGRDSKFIFF